MRYCDLLHIGVKKDSSAPGTAEKLTQLIAHSAPADHHSFLPNILIPYFRIFGDIVFQHVDTLL